jgi:hypothetical protein
MNLPRKLSAVSPRKLNAVSPRKLNAVSPRKLNAVSPRKLNAVSPRKLNFYGVSFNQTKCGPRKLTFYAMYLETESFPRCKRNNWISWSVQRRSRINFLLLKYHINYLY